MEYIIKGLTHPAVLYKDAGLGLGVGAVSLVWLIEYLGVVTIAL